MNKHYKKQNEVKEYDEAVIQIDRVTRVVKGGRRLRFRATVCIGNKKGKVGLGIGKSNEVVGAISKAKSKAKKELFNIPLNGTTIPHDIKMKFKSSKLLLLPAREGTGLIAGGTVRKVLELAGIKNILSKAYGSNNRLNVAKVTIESLRALKVTPEMSKPKKSTSKQIDTPVKNTNPATAEKEKSQTTTKTTKLDTPKKKTQTAKTTSTVKKAVKTPAAKKEKINTKIDE